MKNVSSYTWQKCVWWQIFRVSHGTTGSHREQQLTTAKNARAGGKMLQNSYSGITGPSASSCHRISPERDDKGLILKGGVRRKPSKNKTNRKHYGKTKVCHRKCRHHQTRPGRVEQCCLDRWSWVDGWNNEWHHRTRWGLICTRGRLKESWVHLLFSFRSC